jgi:O-antigen/teichoic acid export membrane protein
MVLGYVFWVVLSKITTADVIGISSTIVSIATIFFTAATLGVSTGVQRFLGKSFSENKFQDSQVYVKASIALMAIGIVTSCVVVLILGDWLHHVFGIGLKLLVVSIVIIIFSAIYTLFRSVVISSLDTKRLPIIMIFSSVAKLVLAIALVLIGFGAFGVTLGFAFFPISATILFTILLIMIFKKTAGNPEVTFKSAFRNVLAASIVSWIPSIIFTTGVHLGTIVVFGANGASQAGVYFIALTIVTGISAATGVLFTIAYPAISSMEDGRKRLAWKITKLTLLIAAPISYSIIFYSKEIMQLFGHGYISGSSTLEILLISTFPNIAATGINTLAYSYGNYRQVLAIGLASNIPRVLLYFILVPIYGGDGAAYSFLIGAVTGLIISVIIAKKIGMRIFWKDIMFILFVPIIFSYPLHHFEINGIVAIAVTLVASYLIFLKIGIITRMDMEDSLGVLPKNIGIPMLSLVSKIAKKFNRSY